MTTDASRRAVFDIPELLESIISFLPAREILTKAQCVSRTWKAAVDSSPTLQTLLWRKSQANQALLPTGFRYTGVMTGSLSFNHVAQLGVGLPVYSGRLAFNEILLTSLNAQIRFTLVQSAILPGTSHLVTMSFTDHMLDQKSRETQPTWLDMYITEQPITIARIGVYLPYRHQSRTLGNWTEATVRDRTGVRFATALNVVEKMKNSLPSTWDCHPYYRLDPVLRLATDGPVHGTGVC